MFWYELMVGLVILGIVTYSLFHSQRRRGLIMGLRKINIASIKIKERTLEFIPEHVPGETLQAEIPHDLVDKASEIFAEEMGTTYADVVFDIDEDKYIVKGFYQGV